MTKLTKEIIDGMTADELQALFDDYWDINPDPGEELYNYAFSKAIGDDHELSHIGCMNWPNCDIEGCGGGY